MDGWIKLHRQIRDHWIWNDPIKFQWWIDMIIIANHADVKVNIGFELYECKRGQSILSLKSWGERWNVSKDTARNFFVLLEKDTMISRETLAKTTRITICNYDTYQSSLHDEQTMSKRKANDEQTIAHPNKNDKNIKNDNNEKEEEVFPSNFYQSSLIPISDLESFLNTDAAWCEVVCMQNNISTLKMQTFVSAFVKLLLLRGETAKNKIDAKSHFSNWLKLELEKEKAGTNKRILSTASHFDESL